MGGQLVRAASCLPGCGSVLVQAAGLWKFSQPALEFNCHILCVVSEEGQSPCSTPCRGHSGQEVHLHPLTVTVMSLLPV